MVDSDIKGDDPISSKLIHRDPRPTAKFRKARFGPVDVEADDRPDGSVLLRSRINLGDYPRTLTERLMQWAERKPDAPVLARRGGTGPFRYVTYGEAWAEVQRLGQALLDRGLSEARPLAILSENGIEHAL